MESQLVIYDPIGDRYFVKREGDTITWDRIVGKAAVLNQSEAHQEAQALVGMQLAILSLEEAQLRWKEKEQKRVEELFRKGRPRAIQRQEVRYEPFGWDPQLMNALGDFQDHINAILKEGWQLGPQIATKTGFIQVLARLVE